MGEECGHGFTGAGSPDQDLIRLQSRCQLGLGSHLSLGDPLPSSHSCWQVHFLAAVELMTACFFKAGRGASLFLGKA